MLARRFKPLALSAFSFMLSFGCMNLAFAQDQQSAADLDAAAIAMPELYQKEDAETRAVSGMSCYVDTIAFDHFTSGYCFAASSPFMTSAVFRIDSPPANFTILWSDSRCSSTNTICIVPIRQYQTITMNATVLNNSNNTFTTASATAEYEGNF